MEMPAGPAPTMMALIEGMVEEMCLLCKRVSVERRGKMSLLKEDGFDEYHCLFNYVVEGAQRSGSTMNEYRRSANAPLDPVIRISISGFQFIPGRCGSSVVQSHEGSRPLWNWPSGAPMVVGLRVPRRDNPPALTQHSGTSGERPGNASSDLGHPDSGDETCARRIQRLKCDNSHNLLHLR